jgi:hypothetical protein
MKKIIELLDTLDPEVIDKLILLERLVTLYAKFMELWRHAEVTSDGVDVRVKFFTINKYGYEQFTERVFPVEDITRRIISYKLKLKKVIKERNENPRIVREKYERSWVNFLKQEKFNYNAKV